MSRGARKTVTEAFEEACRHHNWRLLSRNVRTNHAHAVVAAGAESGKKIRGVLKAKSTRSLRDEGFWRHEHSPWAAKGSVIGLWDNEAIASAIDYVENQQ